MSSNLIGAALLRVFSPAGMRRQTVLSSVVNFTISPESAFKVALLLFLSISSTAATMLSTFCCAIAGGRLTDPVMAAIAITKLTRTNLFMMQVYAVDMVQPVQT